MDELAPPSSEPSPMTIDGADHDLALAKSSVLTRQEVVARRLRRVNQLARCYRDHYWLLMEELKSKHRDYYWTYGKSPLKEEENADDLRKHAQLVDTVNTTNGVQKLVLGSDAVDSDIVRCAFSGCKSKAMALTRFCHSHILADSRQKLYRGCNYVAKTLPTGPSFCNKPVLRYMVPPLCTTHYQFGERWVNRAIRRENYTVPTNRKPNPRVNLTIYGILSEVMRKMYVRRESSIEATVPKAETELETR